MLEIHNSVLLATSLAQSKYSTTTAGFPHLLQLQNRQLFLQPTQPAVSIWEKLFLLDFCTSLRILKTLEPWEKIKVTSSVVDQLFPLIEGEAGTPGGNCDHGNLKLGVIPD